MLAYFKETMAQFSHYSHWQTKISIATLRAKMWIYVATKSRKWIYFDVYEVNLQPLDLGNTLAACLLCSELKYLSTEYKLVTSSVFNHHIIIFHRAPPFASSGDIPALCSANFVDVLQLCHRKIVMENCCVYTHAIGNYNVAFVNSNADWLRAVFT